MKKALLVVDLQNDYLWEKRHKRFAYNTDELIEAVNRLIEQHRSAGCDIIYIAQILPNTWGFRKFYGFSIRGTDGAKFYDKLNVVSDHHFEKFLPDAFSSGKLRRFVKEKNYESVAICGIDEGGCVSATAGGAVKHGLSVEMLVDGTATVFPSRKIEKLRAKLKAKGVKYIL